MIERSQGLESHGVGEAGDETAMLGLARVLSQRKEGKAQAGRVEDTDSLWAAR